MYYLNAFNEMLRKRERQNMMGGGQDQGVGTTAPSGPMGARQSNGMAGVRNALTNMNPFLSAGLSMIPGVRAPLALARLGAYAYDKSQASGKSAYADDSMDRLSFNAPAYGQTGPEYGPAPTGTIDPGAYEGGFMGFGPDAVNLGGGVGAPYYGGTPAVSAPVAPSSISGESLGAADTSYGGFGDATGSSDTMGFAGEYAHGGMVHAEHLKGRAPAPDDGYGALQGGEYVITKAAVEKYGKRLLDAINNGTFR